MSVHIRTCITSSDVTAFIPNEVLLEIFKIISLDNVRKSSNSKTAEGLTGVYWPTCEEISSVTAFPYCISNVCQRWYNLMQTYPEWWCRFRVFLDQGSRNGIITEVHRVIDSTKRFQPLRLFVGYSAKQSVLGVEVEKDLIGNIVEIIRPHICRFESIVIHARHGSSLPLISTGMFSEPNPFLQELQLKCDSYPVVQSLPENVDFRHFGIHPDSRSKTKSFSLDLTLDGPTFLDACMDPTFWKEFYGGVFNVRLKVSHIKTDDSLDAFTFLSIICRPGIGDLTLENVVLPRNISMEERIKNIFGLHYRPDTLTLISMDPTSIQPFLTEKGIDTLTVDNCPLNGMVYPTAENLCMQNISEDQEISDTIICVDPSVLHIIDCPGMDDFTLGTIAHPNGGGTCHSLRYLYVENGRTRITPGGLKRFILGRRRISEKYYREKGIVNVPTFMDMDDYGFPSSDSEPTPLDIVCFDDTGFELSPEDMQFLKEHIRNFEWNSKKSPYF